MYIRRIAEACAYGIYNIIYFQRKFVGTQKLAKRLKSWWFNVEYDIGVLKRHDIYFPEIFRLCEK